MDSSSNPHDYRLNLSTTKKVVCNRITDKGFIQTKFFDESTLDDLGLPNPVQSMLAHGGLDAFLGLEALSHPQMTREFLTMLQTFNDKGGALSHITFQFRNKVIQMDEEEIQSCFEVIKGKTTKVPLKDLQILWTLTSECEMVHDLVGTFLKWAKKIGTQAGWKVSMGGMVTLLVRRKVSLTELGYYDGQEVAYLWEFSPTGDENYVQLPLTSDACSSSSSPLQPANLTSLMFLITNKRRMHKRQHEQMEGAVAEEAEHARDVKM